MKITTQVFGPKLQSEIRIEKDGDSRQIFVQDDFWALEPLRKFFLQNPAVAEFAWQNACQGRSALDKTPTES